MARATVIYAGARSRRARLVARLRYWLTTPVNAHRGRVQRVIWRVQRVIWRVQRLALGDNR